jgi:hypothetical protein
LTELQDLYRVALGLPPLPPPHAIAYLRQVQREAAGQKAGEKDKKEKDDRELSGWKTPMPAKQPDGLVPTGGVVQADGPSKTSSGGEGSTPSSAGGSGGGNDRGVPIEILLSDVPPPGWFHVGCKKDVPKDACYVGCYGDRYAWVMAEGIPALARFTVTLLSVVKLKPGERRGSPSGLAVTSR